AIHFAAGENGLLRRFAPRNDGGEADGSITPRGGDGVHAVVAEHVGHKARRSEYPCKRHVANAETTGIGAERRHHGALAVASKTAPFHRAAARWHAGLGMQMAGDFTGRSRGLMAKRNRAD